jgi:hypothetical protein
MAQGLLSNRAGSGSYYSSLRSGELFPDPFCDMASTAMPDSMQDALRWAEYIWMANGTYRQAMERVIAYFITTVEFTDTEASDEEKEKFKEFLEDRLNIYNLCREVASDYLCYGNAFLSLLVPFRRSLSCKGHGPEGRGCGHEAPLREIYNNDKYNFRWKDFNFHAKCPKCGYDGEWNHIDRRSGEEGEVKIKRWSPHEIEIKEDPKSGDCQYRWKIPHDYRQQITRGDDLFVLERADWEIIQAVKKNHDLLFDPEIVFHMKDAALSGLRNRSWGIPRAITNFRQAWYVQVLHRFNEAIALDYVIPFRVITPMPRGGANEAASDPLVGTNMGQFVSHVNAMLRRRRRDPAAWNVLPQAVQYQALGGEAAQMAPYQLMEFGQNTLLNDVGVPQELYKGTLTAQAAPAALRLFESLWTPLTHNLNGFLRWLIKSVAQYFSWEPVSARLKPITMADDLNQQMAKLQLMMGQQISQETGLAAMGVDFREEQKRLLEEQRYVMQLQKQFQEDMQGQADQQQLGAMAGQQPPPGDPNAAAGGQGDPNAQAAAGMMGGMGGGMGGGAGGQTSADTPQDLMAQADQIAQELLGMEETQRRSEMMQLKKENEALHSIVKSKVEQYRNDAQTAGGAQILSQQFGGGQKAAALPKPKPKIMPGAFACRVFNLVK